MPKKSDVWQHFARVTDEDGEFVKEGECKYCRKVLKTKDGTANMWKHLRKFHPQEDAAVTAIGFGAAPLPQQLLTLPQPHAPSPELPGGSSDRTSWLHEAASEHLARTPSPEGGSSDRTSRLHEAASEHLARMIALRGFDPALLEDECFRSFVASINTEFRVPSRMEMEEMCDGVFDEARKDVFSRLRRAPGRVSLAVGTVTAIGREVLYTACHFIDDEWNLHKVIMDAFVDGLFFDYHGPLLGVEQLTLYCSEDDETSEAVDNVMRALSQRDVLDNLFFMVWGTKVVRVNHLDLRNQIEQNKSIVSPTRTELISTNFLDNQIHYVAAKLLVDPSLDEDMTSDLGSLDLMTRQKSQKLLSQLGLDNLWTYYDNRWYWTYCSMEVLRKEGSTRMNTGSVFAELICTLWDQMYRSIQRISAISSPTSNLCLVEFFKIREALQWELARASGDNANAYRLSNLFLGHDKGKDVADVLGEAMDKLDERIKDSYLVWSIPLILDPRYKLTYIEFIFKRAFADSEAIRYISEVTKQIKKLYGDYIEYGAGINNANSDLVTVTAASSSAGGLEQAWAEHCSSRDGRNHTTTDLDSHLHAEKELDRYLQDFLVPSTESFDILKWWKENSWNYPRVARMARDALAMPTCSKLSSDQLAHVKGILRGYSKAAYGNKP